MLTAANRARDVSVLSLRLCVSAVKTADGRVRIQLKPKTMSQIAVNGVGVDFAGVPIIKDVSFTVSKGDHWGIVGRNGTGKTTLMNVIAGVLAPTRGSVARASALKITLLDQHREAQARLNVWEAAALPFSELIALENSL